MRLLIAEDDPRLLKTLIHIFENNKYAADAVKNEDVLAIECIETVGSTLGQSGILVVVYLFGFNILEGIEAVLRITILLY